MNNHPRRDPDTMTTGEAARELRIGVNTLVRWIEKGKVPAWLVPGSTHRRINRADLVKLAATLEREVPS
jgi:excisionase family DNA binding protein